MRIFVFLVLLTVAIATENLNSHVFPRPLIIEYPEKQLRDELKCTTWRFVVETNNLSPWKTIPEECADYVKEYMVGPGYKMEIDRVSDEAGEYAKSVDLGDDGRDVWIFDVDETLLSNLPYYSDHRYGYD